MGHIMREKVTINGQEYVLARGEKSQEDYRAGLNEITRQTFGFTFEKWYQSGYWDKSCIGYSLMLQNRVVSHITVSVIHFFFQGKEREFVQLGTVSTLKEFRGRGLSRFLMELILQEWADKADLFYLFANDSVLNFYPKFGFTPAKECQCLRPMPAASGLEVRKMDMNAASDRELLFLTAQKNCPQFQLSMLKNPGLVMLYACCFDAFSYEEMLRYIPALNAVAAVEYKGDTLLLYDVMAPSPLKIQDVLAALAAPGITRCALQLVPFESDGIEIVPYAQEDTTLFVLGKDAPLMKQLPVRFPLLSHT